MKFSGLLSDKDNVNYTDIKMSFFMTWQKIGGVLVMVLTKVKFFPELLRRCLIFWGVPLQVFFGFYAGFNFSKLFRGKTSEVYSEPSHISKMELFVECVILVTISQKAPS